MPEDVQLLAVNTVNTPMPSGAVLRTIEITYLALGLPPRRVYVPSEADSNEARQKAIKEDLESARALRPTLYHLP